MKTVVRRRWIIPDESYVEVSYRPASRKAEIRFLVRDGRKAQYYKPKFRWRGWMPFQSVDVVFGMARMHRHITYYRIALEILRDDLRLTSSS